MPKRATQELYRVEVPGDDNYVMIRARLNRGQLQTIQEALLISGQGGKRSMVRTLWETYVVNWGGPELDGQKCEAAVWDSFEPDALLNKVDDEIAQRYRAQVGEEADSEERVKN